MRLTVRREWQAVRLAAWLIAAVALFAPQPSFAAPVMITATFEEQLLGGDRFTITNAGSSATGVLMVSFDLSATDVIFNGQFRVETMGGTGFNGMFTATDTTLTLIFTNFDPGETFRFRVETDDDFGLTSGNDFAGALLSVRFANATPSMAMAAFQQRSLLTARAIVNADVNVGGGGNAPEPGMAGLLLFGLSGFWWARRRRSA
jgi:hypothetical protein